MSILLHAFKEGGIFMYPILAFGLLTLAFIVERYVGLFLKVKYAPVDFRKNILSYIAQGDFKSALAYVEMSAKETSIGKITSVACKLRNVGAGDEALQARMDEQLTKEISFYDKRTGFLSMFGNVATLLGLLGTVSGMIISFSGVASATPAERINMLSTGISEALNATAFGLIVAIPALVAYAIYQNKTDKIVGELTEQASEIYHDFLFYTESHKADSKEHTRVLGVATEAASNMKRN
jgi:biopolymer transport protein ExbB/TolQ